MTRKQTEYYDGELNIEDAFDDEPDEIMEDWPERSKEAGTSYREELPDEEDDWFELGDELPHYVYYSKEHRGHSHHGNTSHRNSRRSSGGKDLLKLRRKAAAGNARRKNLPTRILITVFAVLLAFLIVGTGTLLIMRGRGKAMLQNTVAEETVNIIEKIPMATTEGSVIGYKEEHYHYNENLLNIMLLGIDRSSFNDSGTFSAGDSGQADFVLLASIDKKSGELKLLSVSRDTMVDVDVYGSDAQYLSTDEMQLCLAYAYSDGFEGSCENTARSLSRLLYGMPVHAYAALDMDGLTAMTDAVGGVEVTSLETIGDAFKEGQSVLLTGKNVQTYIRTRKLPNMDAETAANSNNRRMERQKQFMTCFAAKLIQMAKKDVTVPMKLYGAMEPYMVTDLGPASVSYLISLMLSNGVAMEDFMRVPGESVMGETYAEFHPDEEALFELLLKEYYTKD